MKDGDCVRVALVICTEVNYVPAELCKALNSDPNPTIPPGDICLYWPDRDNNACVGDYGGLFQIKWFLKLNLLTI